MNIRVAIVEDNRELREGLAELMDSSGLATSAGAYASCDELFLGVERARPDVVLMDIGLPGMSGIEGVRLLAERYPGIRVLMLTVYDDEERVFESIKAGACGYLLKKTEPGRIVEAVRDLFAGGAPMTPRIARKVLEAFRHGHGPHADEFGLSERERQILNELVKGSSYKMIADTCYISIDTVRSHLRHIYEKLHVHSKSEAVARALKSRIL
jgi:DNA-binding NarL/FixJ family response regulator